MLTALLFFAACAPQECTLIGYQNTLTIHVSLDDGGEVVEPTGTVTVGGVTVEFDCSVEGDGYTCGGSDVQINFPEDATDVQFEVHMPGYVGAGTETPEWTTAEPNGAGCGTQYTGELDVPLYITP
jgi:hypothetical protein